MSDRRLKKDIVPLSKRGSMLDKLGQLDGYSFRMKDDPKGQVEYGVMAQDVKKVFPELVETDATPEHYMRVNYIGMIAPLIEANKEQQAEIKALKASNDKLKAANDNLDARLKVLEAARH